jgi:hypothetical protein
MDFLRYCDFFNVKYNFNYEHKINITIFGGLMGITFIIISIIVIIILSIDDIRKLNPITTKSEIPGGDFRVVNLKESNIYIPWRLITYEEKFINHKGILYPSITLIEGNLDENIGMDLKVHNLNYTLCNETSMINITDQYEIDTPLNELFCIEQNDIPFGGSWLSDKLFYLEVNLFLCEDGIKYNASDNRCTPLQDIVKFTNTTLLFEFFYPNVQFQPTDHDIPMRVIYKNYYYRLSSYTYKLERLYIQENILNDDTSLITTKSKNNSCWGVSTFYGDTYFWQEEQDPLVKSNSSVLFSLDIYMDQGYIYYTRSYKKIFDIISNVFPIVNFLLIIFYKLTVWVKSAFAKQSIVEMIFENSKIFKNKKKFYLNIENNTNNNNMKPRNTIYINKRPKFEDNLKINKDKMIPKKINSINNMHIRDNCSANKEPNKSIMKKTVDHNYKDDSHLELFNAFSIKKLIKSKERNGNNKYLSNIDEKSNNVNKDNKDNSNEEYIPKKEKKSLFPLFYFFMDIFLDKLDKPRSFCCLDKKYLIVYNFMGVLFDISSYVLLFKYFNIYKTVFSEELKSLNINRFDKKININNREMMATLEHKVLSIDSENNGIFSKTIIY